MKDKHIVVYGITSEKDRATIEELVTEEGWNVVFWSSLWSPHPSERLENVPISSAPMDDPIPTGPFKREDVPVYSMHQMRKGDNPVHMNKKSKREPMRHVDPITARSGQYIETFELSQFHIMMRIMTPWKETMQRDYHRELVYTRINMWGRKGDVFQVYLLP